MTLSSQRDFLRPLQQDSKGSLCARTAPSRTQREKRNCLLDSFEKTLEGHNKFLLRHGTNISELQGSTQGTQGQVDALEGRLMQVEYCAAATPSTQSSSEEVR